jgi:hypothetical protein
MAKGTERPEATTLVNNQYANKDKVVIPTKGKISLVIFILPLRPKIMGNVRAATDQTTASKCTQGTTNRVSK